MLGFYNCDCMDGLKKTPDKYYDLAICDPPYGISYDTKAKAAAKAGKVYGSGAALKKQYHTTGWDITPPRAYFDELQRVSKAQIIWGGNYFADMLPPSKGFICWDKRLDERMSNDFADCELAYLSPNLGVARVYRYLYNGMITGDMANKEERIHPTQKPICLYKWLLDHYAKPGDLILDTHVGSGSSLIACEDMGFKYTGYEIDPTYYELAQKRIEEYKAQLRWF